MFERFTDQSRRVLVLAQEESRLLGHSFIGTEHILLGLLREDAGIATEVLRTLGISHEVVRVKVVEVIGLSGTAPSGSPPFTPRAKKVLELSLREAMRLGSNNIGTEHLLLGLTSEGEGVGAQVLVSLGADLPRVREQVVQLQSVRQSGRPSTEQPEHRPSCPRCTFQISEYARHQKVSVPPDSTDSDAEPLSIKVVFCSQCGATLGMFQSGDANESSVD